MKANRRALDLINATRELDPEERLGRLRHEVEAAALELQLSESFSLLFAGSNLQVGTEHPHFDDGEVWDEIGLRGFPGRSRLGRLRTQQDLIRAREVGRFLAEENEYAIGSMSARVNYAVGTGYGWRLVPKVSEGEDPALTMELNEQLQDWIDEEGLGEVEQETQWRADRDGEAILRLFPQRSRAPRLRFVEPEDVRSPGEDGLRLVNGSGATAITQGVEHSSADVQDVRAIWVHPFPQGSDPQRVPVEEGGLRTIHHLKVNVDRASPRGWPTYWPCRRNLFRAEKLMRNMSYVATLQAAIALIRKHEAATESQVQSFVRRGEDARVTNNVTGKETSFRGIGPGTVIDTGPGFNYEAPISTLNASNNVEIVDAELRASASRVQQPEYMFSGNSRDANYSSTLVAEGPSTKQFERLQATLVRFFKRLVWQVIRHEEKAGRMDSRVLTDYVLQASVPGLTVRDQLQETQRNAIMGGAGVLSTATWRSREGLDNLTEERNMQPARAAEAGEAPAAGDSVADQAFNGAQVQALTQIVSAVATGELEPDSAKQAILLAFPTVTPEQADALIDPAAGAQGPAPSPAEQPAADTDEQGADMAAGANAAASVGGADQVGNLSSPQTAPTVDN